MDGEAKEHQSTEDESISFFVDDFIDRLLKRVLREKFYKNPFFLFLGSFLFFWLPVYLLSLLDRNFGRTSTSVFIGDYAAYAQYLVGIPLLLLARNVLDHEWRNIQYVVIKSNIISGINYKQYRKTCKRIKNIIFSRPVSLLVILAGYLISFSWFVGELTNSIGTYHTYIVPGERIERPTLAGIYIAFVSIPFYSVLIVYWFTRYTSWVIFLWRLAKSRPKIIGHHIDRTGGLQFLSQPIAVFGIIIFAVGVVLVATTFYKINIEGIGIKNLQVLTGPIVYIFLAPLLFIVPFFFFTKQLYVARSKSILELNRLGFRFHQLPTHANEQDDSFEDIENFSSLGDLSDVYANVVKMKIWPLDVGSVFRLFVSAIVPMLPLFSKFIDLPEPIDNFLSIFFG